MEAGDLGGLLAARQGTGGGNHLKSSQTTALKNIPQFHILSWQDSEDCQIPIVSTLPPLHQSLEH